MAGFDDVKIALRKQVKNRQQGAFMKALWYGSSNTLHPGHSKVQKLGTFVRSKVPVAGKAAIEAGVGAAAVAGVVALPVAAPAIAVALISIAAKKITGEVVDFIRSPTFMAAVDDAAHMQFGGAEGIGFDLNARGEVAIELDVEKEFSAWLERNLAKLRDAAKAADDALGAVRYGHPVQTVEARTKNAHTALLKIYELQHYHAKATGIVWAISHIFGRIASQLANARRAIDQAEKEAEGYGRLAYESAHKEVSS